ncbi:MAG: hypothetical protein WCD69_11265 [Xanthobacteraceae bacterium]
MKKLLLAAVLIALFTLNGVDQVQLVPMIAFSAVVYVTRFLAGGNRQHLSFPSA